MCLTHRVVNDTGEHYCGESPEIEDDKCKEYEKLVEQGVCRYVSMVARTMSEDPETDNIRWINTGKARKYEARGDRR